MVGRVDGALVAVDEPVEEVVVGIGNGQDVHLAVAVVGAAADDDTHGGIVGGDGYHGAAGIGEDGVEGGIAEGHVAEGVATGEGVDAVAPAAGAVAGGGGGDEDQGVAVEDGEGGLVGDGHAGAVGYGTLGAVVAHDDGVTVDGEGGCEQRVGDGGDDARVVAIAVIPDGEVVACGGDGGEGDGGGVVGRVGARDGTHGGVVADAADGIAVGGEEGGDDSVAQGSDVDGDGGVARAPMREVVARIGIGGEGDGGEVVGAAAAADGAHGGIVGAAVDSVLVIVEVGRHVDVLLDAEGRGGAGDAVAPAEEVVAIVGDGGGGGGSAVGVVAGTGDIAHGGVGTGELDGVVHLVEDGGEIAVARGYDGHGVVGAAVAPVAEGIARIGGGGEDDGEEVGDRRGAAHAATRGIAGMAGDGEAQGREVGGDMDGSHH